MSPETSSRHHTSPPSPSSGRSGVSPKQYNSRASLPTLLLGAPRQSSRSVGPYLNQPRVNICATVLQVAAQLRLLLSRHHSRPVTRVKLACRPGICLCPRRLTTIWAFAAGLGSCRMDRRPLSKLVWSSTVGGRSPRYPTSSAAPRDVALLVDYRRTGWTTSGDRHKALLFAGAFWPRATYLKKGLRTSVTHTSACSVSFLG